MPCGMSKYSSKRSKYDLITFSSQAEVGTTSRSAGRRKPLLGETEGDNGRKNFWVIVNEVVSVVCYVRPFTPPKNFVRRPEKVFCHAQRSRANSVLLFALSDGVSKSLFWSTTDLGCAVNVFSCPLMFLRTRSRNAQFLRGFRECGTGCAVAQPTD